MPSSRHQLAGPAFAELTETQEMVVSRDQLEAHKADRHLIARRVARGHWQVLGPHVVVLRPGPLTRPQQLWVGVLHGGDDSVLTGLTALEAAGLTGFRSDDISVCAPHGRNRDDLESDLVTVHVHESRNMPSSHRLSLARPPRMRPERATIDAASRAVTDRASRTLVAMSVQQRLTTAATLRRLVLRRHNLPRRALILETIGDVEGGSESLPELDYLSGLRRFGLPIPSRQSPVQGQDGRYRLDAEFDPWAVTVEINGTHHLDVRQKEADDIRRSRLAIGGRLVVDIGSSTVRHDIELAVLLTADALFSRGWDAAPEVRQRLLTVAKEHATFTWTSDLAA